MDAAEVAPVGARDQALASSHDIHKDGASPELEVRSPADIFRLMSHIEGSSKSVESASSSTRQDTSLESIGRSGKEAGFAPPLRPVAAQAFSGEIREHALPANSSSTQQAGPKSIGG